MPILKKIEGNELYLYMNGRLIYKRWLDTGQSLVFDVVAYSKYTLASITELAIENNRDFLTVNAKVKLKTTAEGGRKTGFISGYRPNHVFEYAEDGRVLQTYIGDIQFDGKPTVDPGEVREVTVRFLLSQPIEKYIEKGRVWWLHEGGRQIGQAEII